MGYETRVHLDSGIFNIPSVKTAGSIAVTKTAHDYKDKTGQKMIAGPQTGNTYKYKGKSHRASARGERPAKLSGKLIEGIEVRQLSETVVEVVSTAKNKGYDYPAHLQNDLDRLIMTEKDAQEQETILQQNYEAEIGKLIL